MTDKGKKHIVDLADFAGAEERVGDGNRRGKKKKKGGEKTYPDFLPSFDLPSPLGPGEGMDDAGFEEPEISWDKPTPDGDD